MRRYQQLPIRTGCYVEFVQTLSDGYQRLCVGHVVSHHYDENGYHHFTIRSKRGDRSVTVSGRKLYKNLLKHISGEASRIEERRCQKREKRRRKALRRNRSRLHQPPKRNSLRKLRARDWQ